MADLAAHRALARAFAEGFRSSPHAISGQEWLDREDLMTRAWELACCLECGDLTTDSHQIQIESLCRFLGLGQNRRQTIQDVVFGLLISKDCPPYETEYLPLRDTTYISQEMADIAGFYRAFGLEPDKSHPERVDHVSLELDFVDHLLTRMIGLSQSYDPRSELHFEVTESALREFVECHLGRWVPLFAMAFDRRIDILIPSVSVEYREDLGHYRQFGLLLNQWVENLCGDFGIHPTPITLDGESNDSLVDDTASIGCEGCMNF
ncbi:MAG: molecular chaperone TorD family protein [Candidatus Omnitrophica bacterium]|nr:molecular chaperone TorD family protein [Candidatus Omnitrophota bacterium]MCA9415896.1 molecular chaperone TorD family protein [Candidatus Omnitrophota bacterium]MCA9436712.1 molecular chaperone TorD family protein [Candidatus Omnitrophota bacterium]